MQLLREYISYLAKPRFRGFRQIAFSYRSPDFGASLGQVRDTVLALVPCYGTVTVQVLQVTVTLCPTLLPSSVQLNLSNRVHRPRTARSRRCRRKRRHPTIPRVDPRGGAPGVTADGYGRSGMAATRDRRGLAWELDLRGAGRSPASKKAVSRSGSIGPQNVLILPVRIAGAPFAAERRLMVMPLSAWEGRKRRRR